MPGPASIAHSSVPFGAPAVNQASIVARSAALSVGLGGCGIGDFVSWMRSSTAWYTFAPAGEFVGWLSDGVAAWKSSHVTSGIGAAFCVGLPWHVWQCSTTTASTSQGSGVAPGLDTLESAPPSAGEAELLLPQESERRETREAEATREKRKMCLNIRPVDNGDVQPASQATHSVGTRPRLLHRRRS